MRVGGGRRHSPTVACSSSSVFGAYTRPRSPTTAWNSAAMRGFRRFARERGLTMTAITRRRLLRRRWGRRRRWRRLLPAAPRSSRRFLGTALQHLGDLSRLLLVRDVERRLLAIAPLRLLEADD